MKYNTTTIRITQLNKILLRKYIFSNFKDKNPSIDHATDNDLITFLIRENTGIYFLKIKSEGEHELNKYK